MPIWQSGPRRTPGGRGRDGLGGARGHEGGGGGRAARREAGRPEAEGGARGASPRAPGAGARSGTKFCKVKVSTEFRYNFWQDIGLERRDRPISTSSDTLHYPETLSNMIEVLSFPHG